METVSLKDLAATAKMIEIRGQEILTYVRRLKSFGFDEVKTIAAEQTRDRAEKGTNALANKLSAIIDNFIKDKALDIPDAQQEGETP